jgi:hypothetical protein
MEKEEGKVMHQATRDEQTIATRRRKRRKKTTPDHERRT